MVEVAPRKLFVYAALTTRTVALAFGSFVPNERFPSGCTGVEPEVLSRVAHDPDAVNGRVEVETELSAVKRYDEGSPDLSCERGPRVDEVEAARAPEPVELARRGTKIDAEDVLLALQTANQRIGPVGLGAVREEAPKLVSSRDDEDELPLIGDRIGRRRVEILHVLAVGRENAGGRQR
jgi:hypothetical protein